MTDPLQEIGRHLVAAHEQAATTHPALAEDIAKLIDTVEIKMLEDQA